MNGEETQSHTVETVDNERRRRLLQFGALGGGALLAGWFLRPLLSLFQDGIALEKEALFENFRVVETKNELQFYDRKTDEAILVIEK